MPKLSGRSGQRIISIAGKFLHLLHFICSRVLFEKIFAQKKYGKSIFWKILIVLFVGSKLSGAKFPGGKRPTGTAHNRGRL
jgi:hypothetical protein